MRIFRIRKGGETENVEEAIVVLERRIDDELLKKAINICAEQQMSIAETINYIDSQFMCVDFTTFENLDTFYC